MQRCTFPLHYAISPRCTDSNPVTIRLRQKLFLILKATRQHARNLGIFAFLYKSTMLAMRNISGKESRYDSFVAGLLGGYVVFGRSRSSVSQQIVIYVFSRVVLAISKLALTSRVREPVAGVGDIFSHGSKIGGSAGGWGLIADEKLARMVRKNSWPVFATLSWACVMYLFRWHPDSMQPSLRSSMHYM